MLHLQEGEQVDIKARKHWFSLFRDSFGIIVIYLIPYIVWKFLINYTDVSIPELDTSVVTFILSAWTLILWAKFFNVWTDYYLDIWVVTNNRIMNIEQKGLFKREVSTLRIERIQDVTIKVDGIVATVLGFGDVCVQTAGETEEFVIEGIANPENVKRKILRHIDDKTSQRMTYV